MRIPVLISVPVVTCILPVNRRLADAARDHRRREDNHTRARGPSLRGPMKEIAIIRGGLAAALSIAAAACSTGLENKTDLGVRPFTQQDGENVSPRRGLLPGRGERD